MSLKSLKSLKTLAKQSHPVQLTVEVNERLPYYIQAPCVLTCEVAVQHERRYYVLNLKSSGQLIINCQRCLQDFAYAYNHKSEVAICESDEIANQLMSSMDCMVQSDDDLDLLEIVTDDLHLFSPEKHDEC
ncbi:MAG: hypothetical protein EBY22_05765 [Gammaproteobacteria bacterium]|nr:hypothetical protein [Gammaproteobacteria bacterium]